MTRHLVLLTVIAAFIAGGCKDKQKAPAPVAADPTPLAGSGSSPPAAPAEPISGSPDALEKGIVDGAASLDGKLLSLVIRGSGRPDDIDAPNTPGFLLFAKTATDPKAALDGKWTAFRIFGPGHERAGARQAWTFASDRLTIARLGKEAPKTVHTLSFDRDQFSYPVDDASDSDQRMAIGVTTGRVLLATQLGPLRVNPDDATESRENMTTIAVREVSCDASAVEGKWRAFRMGSRQLAEWTLKAGSFDMTVWNDLRAGAGKTRKGNYTFNATNCSAVLQQVRDDAENQPTSQETFFDPESGIALSGRGEATMYSNTSIWFQIGNKAPSVIRAGPWVVFRQPPRVGFITMDAAGGFDGSTGNTWNEPLTPISGSVIVSADRVTGEWIIQVPEATGPPSESPSEPE